MAILVAARKATGYRFTATLIAAGYLAYRMADLAAAGRRRVPDLGDPVLPAPRGDLRRPGVPGAAGVRAGRRRRPARHRRRVRRALAPGRLPDRAALRPVGVARTRSAGSRWRGSSSSSPGDGSAARPRDDHGHAVGEAQHGQARPPPRPRKRSGGGRPRLGSSRHRMLAASRAITPASTVLTTTSRP